MFTRFMIYKLCLKASTYVQPRQLGAHAHYLSSTRDSRLNSKLRAKRLFTEISEIRTRKVTLSQLLENNSSTRMKIWWDFALENEMHKIDINVHNIYLYLRISF